MANLGNVAIKPEGEWIIGVVYKPLNAVTHNGNFYLALQENAVEPTDDGVNWMLILEGVPIATEEKAGKSKPDGKTITIDTDGTLHGASQVPEGVTYVDLDGTEETLPERIPINADTLEGHNAEYFAAKADIPAPTEPWDYTVKYPNKITLKNSAGEDIGWIQPNNDKSYSLISANDNTAMLIHEDGLVEGLHGFNFKNGGELAGSVPILQFSGEVANLLKAIHISPNSQIIFKDFGGDYHFRIYKDGQNNLILQKYLDNKWITAVLLNASGVFYLQRELNILNSVPINFLNTAGGYNNRFIVNDHDQLIFQTRDPSGQWINAMYFSDETGDIHAMRPFYGHFPIVLSTGQSIQFESPQNHYVTTQIINSNNVTYFQYRAVNASTWNTSARLDANGVWRFYNNIDAPNVASTAALTEAEQQITEQDLNTIELQQKVAKLEAQIAELKGSDTSEQANS